MIEILRTATSDFEKVIVAAGNVMTLGDLLHFFDGPEERGAVAWLASET